MTKAMYYTDYYNEYLFVVDMFSRGTEPKVIGTALWDGVSVGITTRMLQNFYTNEQMNIQKMRENLIRKLKGASKESAELKRSVVFFCQYSHFLYRVTPMRIGEFKMCVDVQGIDGLM